MEKEREIFAEFLREKRLYSDKTMSCFDLYHDFLLEENRNVNLISRQTNPEEIWTLHFYDSLLPVICGFDFTGKTVLDLGSGGGLPGIPLAIINPAGQFILLDSRPKKIELLKKVIKKLDLNNCYPICKRLEEFKGKELREILPDEAGFDTLVSRSVKITPKLLKKMMVLLKENGSILLYKGKKIEESFLIQDAEVFSFDKPWRMTNLLYLKKS